MNFLNIFKVFNFWSYPLGLYQDYKIWSIIREACKEKATLERFAACEPELRVNRIYQIYTVVNVPGDYAKNKTTSWTYMMGQLRKIEEALFNTGIGELVIPEIDTLGPTAYLVMLKPAFEHFGFFNLLKEILRWVFLYFFMYGINNVVYHEFGISIFEKIGEFFKIFVG